MRISEPALSVPLAGRLIGAGSAIIAGSVLADSAMEHYRGSFANPAMVLPLAASGMSVAVNAARAAGTGTGKTALVSHGAASAIGVAGLGFHLFNLLKRPGRLRLNSLFYKAPIGAPAALVLAGTLGLAADVVARGALAFAPFGIEPARLLAGYTAFGILGTVGEAGLLHFRGAFHNPAMWLPVSVPPLAAFSLVKAALTGRATLACTALLAATAALGVVGSLFHAYGVQRNMGGWRNWRQNLLAGPPLPAPPAFTGLAIAGLGALVMMAVTRRG